ncbi:hypothetical protein BpHYR1_006260 [Brachionus plicatilis]|uniref:Uncharacterized protein n=1 Tax=Brachionus plicatilis TaxID=10195 RepID=A0A3M7P2P7_BRAPC|nr:hypothetical protein BpHYR1_006260 [Brachionus plicatilis]
MRNLYTKNLANERKLGPIFIFQLKSRLEPRNKNKLDANQ